ncbi:HAD-IB family phosphatase [bacterium]|nr:HAD-IB family phosphatase [bacterium]
MAEPRMFISSTYSDLKDVRAEIADFITKYGYIPVVFEKDDVTFQLNQPIENSCYDEISECSLFILILKEKFGSFSKFSDRTNSSVTQNEYHTARSLGLPIFVFIFQSTVDEYNSWKKHGMPKDFIFNYIDGIHMATFINEIYEDKAFRYIHTYNSTADIKTKLNKQWAGLFHKYLTTTQKFRVREKQEISVNPYKLFYFRRHQGLSQKQLANKTGISESKIKGIEDTALHKSKLEPADFKKLTFAELNRVADSLQCSIGNLKAGLPDDFLSQYLLYYLKNKGTQVRKKKNQDQSSSLFKTKAVVFDFDGTLTYPSDDLTTWEKIWIKLGYNVNECHNLHREYSTSQITHKKWCELTESKFKEKNLSELTLKRISQDFRLVDGTSEVLDELTSYNIQLYICSGSIDYVVKTVLGENAKYFREIKANKMLFDHKGYLKSIIGTKYDFEGKADFINQIVNENGIQPYEVLFVGNSLNDEWAHQSGATTLCVNPSKTNPDHPFQWNHCIREMKDLKDTLRFLNYK